MIPSLPCRRHGKGGGPNIALYVAAFYLQPRVSIVYRSSILRQADLSGSCSRHTQTLRDNTDHVIIVFQN